ncbi:MAG: ABC-F family ATP-binding cassette domain-containing protein, partial [Pedobacter sp.]
MFILHQISYLHANREQLFDQLDLFVETHNKIALVGNNGTGKSTLLKIISGEIQPTSGRVELSSKPYYVPQHFGQYNDLTISEALKVDGKLKGLKAILGGDGSEENFALLEDDWTIEDKCLRALSNWGLSDLELGKKLNSLSGGEKTKVFLSGIEIHEPQIILLDEPSNHLDNKGRALLYDLVENIRATMLIVSHDRTLLNLLNSTFELSERGIKVYGGNYDFYVEQKKLKQQALTDELHHRESELNKAKAIEREMIQRQQKLDARGKKKQEKSGVSRIMMNTLRNKAENSTTKAKGIHALKITGINDELRSLRSSLANHAQIKIDFPGTNLHRGKILFKANQLNHFYNGKKLWDVGLSFQITSLNLKCPISHEIFA